jgi:hypothetical protein
VFSCWNNCITSENFTNKIDLNDKWLPLVERRRVAAARYSSGAFIFAKSYKDGCGDMAGPLITKMMMDQIVQKKTTNQGSA